MKTQTSVKAYSGKPIEGMAIEEMTPLDIIVKMEERFGASKMTEPEVDLGPFSMPLLNKMDRIRLQREFGKWLPKTADKVIEEAREGLTTIEERMAAMCSAIERLKSIEKWKDEQRSVRRAQRHNHRENTAKVEIDGKKQWQDATVYELPPLVKSEGTGVTHEPARYALRLPDGRYIDLGMTQNGFKPVDRTNPSAAMQSIAKRLGIEMRGGDCEILRHLVGRNDILPAYTTVWHRDKWLVIVGWQRDPKVTLSRYWEGDGCLTERNPNPDTVPMDHPEYVERLTLSELDYTLLCGSAEEKLDLDEDDVPDPEELQELGGGFLNDEEEYVMAGVQHIQNEEETPIENWLLTNAAYGNNRFVELRNGSAIWNDADFRDELALIGRQQIRDKHRISKRVSLMKNIRSLLLADIVKAPTEKKKERFNELGKLISKLENLRRGAYTQFLEELHDLRSQVKLCKEERKTRDAFPTRGSADCTRKPANWDGGFVKLKEVPKFHPRDYRPPAKEPVKRITRSHRMPENTVPAPSVREVENMPEHRSTVMQTLKRGRTALVLTKDGPVKRSVPTVKPKPITARNAPDALKTRIRKMIASELEGNSIENVQKAFNDAFETALRGLTGSALRA